MEKDSYLFLYLQGYLKVANGVLICLMRCCSSLIMDTFSGFGFLLLIKRETESFTLI